MHTLLEESVMSRLKSIIKVLGIILASFFCLVSVAPGLVQQQVPVKRGMQGPANGEFVIFVQRDGKWHETGSLPFDQFFRTQVYDLSGYLQTPQVRLKIQQRNGGASHLDAVTINGKTPRWISGNSLAEKVHRRDFDVIDSSVTPVEFLFELAADDIDSPLLEISGRIENRVISKTPFQYPLDNLFREIDTDSLFYSYALGSQSGSLNLDGDITGEDLETPFFAEYYPVGSGHPQGVTYGWIRDDGKNLYVAIDFTPDNTLDGEKDYAKVFVKTETGVKSFKLSVPEQRWGRVAFSYTDKVVYQHKTYEFQIPLAELGIDSKSPLQKELQLAFAAYGTATPIVNVANAYNSTNSEYLAAWTEYDTFGDIYVQRINQSGSSLDSSNTVSDSASFLISDAVYDSSNNRYLLIWYNIDSYGVYSRAIKQDGTAYSAMQTLSTANQDREPAVAFDSENKRYLVVWGDGTNGDIYGRLVNADGTLYSGSSFVVASDGSETFSDPDVAFDSKNKKFLVVFSAANGGKYIYGKMLQSDGTSDGGSFSVSNLGTTGPGAENRFRPSISCDSTNQRFLAVWQDYRNATDYEIYGQIINADKSLYDHDGSETADPSNDNFAITSNSTDQEEPVVSYNSGSNTYLVAWIDNRGTNQDIYRQIVNVDGTLSGSNTSLNTNSSGSKCPFNLALASNTYCKNFLITNSYDDCIGSNHEYGNNSIVGACNPSSSGPTLSWVTGETNGVDPDSGAVGTTFSFKVKYTSSSNTAPTTRQLQIDLNGDGSFANADTTVLPLFKDPLWSGPTLAGIALAFLGLMLLLSLFSGFRISAIRLTTGLTAIVLVATVLYSCASSDGGGAENGVTEIYTLSATDSEDTDYTDGVDYQVRVTINNSGTFTYKFGFSDSTSAAGGEPAQEQSLMVE